MQELINYFQQYKEWNPSATETIFKYAHEVSIKRHEILFEQGQVPDEMAYVSVGAMSATRSVANGQERIFYFVVAGDFATDLDDFVNQRPVRLMTQAVVDSRVILLRREAFHHLSKSIPLWDELWSKIASRGLIETIRRRAPVVGPDPRTRCVNFEERYPGLIDKIPNKIVASYLDINAATLSRMRGRGAL
ncbi:MAG: Crp/Fnr family transcriptional regulator [Chryseolinea sp.]